jgi:uncharacterized membrane protein
VSLNDWILALHLLAAVALVAAEVMFTVMIAGLWRSDSPTKVASTMPLARLGVLFVMIGMAGTVVFGVWLAISREEYQLWDGWIIAALVLWALGGFLGQKSGEAYQAGGELGAKLVAEGTTSSSELAETFGASRAFWLHNATLLVVVLIVVDMIWKPGA